MNNFTILAQNNNDDYVKQAYLCALSIKSTNSNSKVCLITNEKVNEKYKQVFDDIVAFLGVIMLKILNGKYTTDGKYIMQLLIKKVL